MTQINSTEFKTQTSTLFATNGTGAITATDLRTQMDNIADSVVFLNTGNSSAPTANDDGSDTAGNGVFQVGHIWIDETNNEAYICVDNSTGAAVWLELTISSGAEIAASITSELGSNDWKNEPPAVLSVTSSRTLLPSDANDILEVDTNSGAVVLTIPSNSTAAFDIGTHINLTLIDNSNSFTVTADTGVMLNGVSAGSGVITSTAYVSARLYKKATDSWVITGSVGTVS